MKSLCWQRCCSIHLHIHIFIIKKGRKKEEEEEEQVRIYVCCKIEKEMCGTLRILQTCTPSDSITTHTTNDHILYIYLSNDEVEKRKTARCFLSDALRYIDSQPVAFAATTTRIHVLNFYYFIFMKYSFIFHPIDRYVSFLNFENVSRE